MEVGVRGTPTWGHVSGLGGTLCSREATEAQPREPRTQPQTRQRGSLGPTAAQLSSAASSDDGDPLVALATVLREASARPPSTIAKRSLSECNPGLKPAGSTSISAGNELRALVRV